MREQCEMVKDNSGSILLSVPCKVTFTIQVPYLVCKIKHEQSRENGERNVFSKYYMIFQEHIAAKILCTIKSRMGNKLSHLSVPGLPLCSEVYLQPSPSSFNWLQLPLALASANNKALKTRFSVLQSELLGKVKCKATKSI